MASKAALAAVLFFVTGMALAITQAPPSTFTGPPPPIVVAVTFAFLLFHLSLLPVVAALDAPGWAKGSGYAWIAIDNVLNFLSYFGVGAELVVPMRMGVHLACGAWIIGASQTGGGAFRTVGWLEAIALVGVSIVAPFVGAEQALQMLGPSALLLVLWLVMASRRLAVVH